MADDWPLEDSVELGALDSGIPCAWARTRQVLWKWGLGNADAVDLLVTELLINVVKAAQPLPRPVPCALPGSPASSRSDGS